MHSDRSLLPPSAAHIAVRPGRVAGVTQISLHGEIDLANCEAIGAALAGFSSVRVARSESTSRT